MRKKKKTSIHPYEQLQQFLEIKKQCFLHLFVYQVLQSIVLSSCVNGWDLQFEDNSDISTDHIYMLCSFYVSSIRQLKKLMFWLLECGQILPYKEVKYLFILNTWRGEIN